MPQSAGVDHSFKTRTASSRSGMRVPRQSLGATPGMRQRAMAQTCRASGRGAGAPGPPPLRLADARPCDWGFRRRATGANASRRRARIHAEAVSGVAEEPAHARPDAGQRCVARHAGRISAPWQTAGGAVLPKTGDAAAPARPESEGSRQPLQKPNKNSNYSSLQIGGRRFRQLCRA